MKKILLLCVLGLFYGCGPTKSELDKAVADAVASKMTDSTNITIVMDDKAASDIRISKVVQVMKPDGQGGGSIRFLAIDGHDYIQWYSDNGASMTHSESCTNEIHTNTNK